MTLRHAAANTITAGLNGTGPFTDADGDARDPSWAVPGYGTGPATATISAIDDDLDEDESYFLEEDDDDDDDEGYEDDDLDDLEDEDEPDDTDELNDDDDDL